jgi:hypothetical protein
VDTELQFCKMRTDLEMETLGMCLVPLNCTLINGGGGQFFMLCLFHYN